MKFYALINYGTGEVYTITAPTCQALYKRAMHIRRECIRYGYMQDNIRLLTCDSYADIHNGSVIAEWKGGSDTPILDMGVSMPLYNRLHRRGIDTAESLAEYAKGMMIFSRLPSRMIREVIEVLQPYDKRAAMKLTRHLNERGFKRGV